MTVAEQYPARTDTNGTTWYRPEYGDLKMWGWTSQLDQADPSYTQPKENTMTELTEGVQYARYSEFSRYPLPPFPEQVDVAMDGWNRYKLPHPKTGKPTAYTRATTVASTIADYYTLNRWKQRTKVAAIVKLIEISTGEREDGVQQGGLVDRGYADKLLLELKRLIAEEPSEKGLGKHIDLIDDLMGAADARELGGAVHDWIAELAMGRILLWQIPEVFQPYATAYQDAMARAGLIDIPEYTERLVLNEKGAESVAGRIDGICKCVETGELYLLDRKTSKTLDFSALEYGVQFAVYGYADWVLAPDRKGWEPMPAINQEQAFCIHVPSDQPERSQVVPFNLYPGGEGMITAFDVRDKRRNADKRILGGAYPVPSDESIRYVLARQAIQNMTDEDEATAIFADFGDVWDDDLDRFGAQCFGLLDNNINTESEN